MRLYLRFHFLSYFISHCESIFFFLIFFLILGYASEVLDLACQGYDLESEKCKRLTLPNGGFKERENGLVLYRNTTDRPLSLIPPFIDIFTQN